MSTKGTAVRLGNLAATGGAGAGEAEEMARRVMDVHATNRAEQLRTVPVGQLARSPWQPRHGMDPEALAELAESIRSRGVLEPLLARELGGGEKPQLELLAGERRLEAARLAGLATVPVRVLRDLSDAEAREVALVENLARSDLSPWEEAHAVAGLRDARKAEGKPADVRALAAVAGRGKTKTAELLAIADALTPDVVKLANASAGASGALGRTPDKLPHEALYGAAKGTTEAERARLLALYAGARAPATEAAKRTKRSRAATSGTQPFTIKGGVDTRLVVTVRRPVAELDKEAAADLLERLRPIVEALEKRLEEVAGQQTQGKGDTWERQ